MAFKHERMLFVLIIAGALASIPTLTHAQVKGRRDAYGAERASHVEALLGALFPTAAIQWDPVLAIRDASGTFVPVDLGNFASTAKSTGQRLV